ncbi:MAG: ABC transporter permease [Flexibacteraceae bacterium]
MIADINYEIAVTHIVTRKKQTFVAALGVTIGVAIYLFMNSLSAGFSGYSRDLIFQNNAHIKIYQSDEMSKPLIKDSNTVTVIANPQITTLSKKLLNPTLLLKQVKAEPLVTNAIAQIDFSVFYNRGKTQVKGSGFGVNMVDYAAMFGTEKFMVAGNVSQLQGNQNGIIIGQGIADKLSLRLGDNITITSSYGVSKIQRIVGIFKTGNALSDDSRCYVNLSTAQQLVKEGSSYVTTIYANTKDPDRTEECVKHLQSITNYTVEDWKTTSADVINGDKTRRALMGAISFSILVVAAFGIYNILSSTIQQKINDIAILKANGFKGADVIKIFVAEALIMGIIGTIMGLIVAAILITIMSNVYMGPPVGYFPIKIQLDLFIQSFLLGMFIVFCAGYFPARKAARIDPVSIFRG